MSDRSFRVALVGATGLVGREILAVLEDRHFPVAETLLYAGDGSAGTEIQFAGQSVVVGTVPEELPAVDVAFLCASASVNERIGRPLAAKGALVIDLAGDAGRSAASPLVLGPSDVSAEGAKQPLRLASAAARLLVMPLRALAEAAPLRRAIVTLVVPASAFGVAALEKLGEETIALLNTRGSDEEEKLEDEEIEGGEGLEGAEPADEADSVAFRCEPVNARGGWAADVERQAEQLLMPGVVVSVQAVKAPVFYGQAASMSVEIAAPIPFDEIRQRLREAPSLILLESDDVRTTYDTVGIDGIQVTGLRVDPVSPTWIHFWVLAENVRQGAALPAVVLAESLLLRH